MPTMLERPNTTALAPSMVVPERSSSSITPDGVHDANAGSCPFIAIAPMLSGWNPSTSLDSGTASRMVFSSMWFGQRQLHEDAVHRAVLGELLDQRQHLVLRRAPGQDVRKAVEAGLVARLDLHADVFVRSRVVADQHGGETGRDALFGHKGRGGLLDLVANVLGDGFAVNDLRAHDADRKRFVQPISRAKSDRG